MLARRLTASGIEQFQLFLRQSAPADNVEPPTTLLTDSRTSAALDVELNVRQRQFCSRLELAEHLFGLLRTDTTTLRNDRGFWTWLSLYWFRQLCPVANQVYQPGNQVYQPGNTVRWIADLNNPRCACRHLIAGPFQIYRAHRDDPLRALSLLCDPVSRTNPLVRLIASRPSLVTCRAVVGAATRLFYSSETGKNRSGLNGCGPGSPRRFTDLLNQLDLTWDLHSLTTDELLELLPAEFDHFHRVGVDQRGLRQRTLLD